MKSLIAIVGATLLSISNVNASDQFLGLWSSGVKEVLNVSENDGALQAEFIRENVKSEFEKIRFPAAIKDGALVISSEQGNLSAKYDNDKKLLILGGVKAFQKLTEAQALALIESIQKK